MLFFVMKLSLIVYNIAGPGGKGVACSSASIRYCPQTTLSTYFRAIRSRCVKYFCRGLYISLDLEIMRYYKRGLTVLHLI